MNLGLVASYIIGGLMILTIGVFTVNVSQHSTDLTLQSMTKTHLEPVYDLVSHDFQKIAYDITGPIDNAILIADSNRIAFESNINNGAQVKIIMWELTDDSVSGSGNVDQRILKRIESGFMEIDTPSQTVVTGAQTNEILDITTGVTQFRLTYFQDGSETPMSFPMSQADRNLISRINVFIETQNQSAVRQNNGTLRFPTVQWRKMFIPPNINLD